MTPDSQSIGDTRPTLIFEKIIAAMVAIMNAAVAVKTPRMLLAMKNTNSGPKSIASFRPALASFCFAASAVIIASFSSSISISSRAGNGAGEFVRIEWPEVGHGFADAHREIGSAHV